MHYSLRDDKNALALVMLEKEIKNVLGASLCPDPIEKSMGSILGRDHNRSELRGNTFSCFCVIQLTNQPTNDKKRAKNKTSMAAKTEPNSAPGLLVSLNTNALHNTAFIYVGISVIVISFQYFLVPVPQLTPIASHLPPPVSVCVCV